MIVRFFALLALIMFAGELRAQEHPGYISDVLSERDEHFYEIYLFLTPPPPQKKLQDIIFNTQLSTEFKNKYRERFGEIDTESMGYQKANYGVLDIYRSGDNPIVHQSTARRTFAEYMVKRLTEWHVDNYFKSDPAMRPVYEMKERLSKVQVAVTQNSRLDLNYSYAGNTLDINYVNPYLDSKMTLEMDPSNFGPSEVLESRLQLGKNLRTDLRLNANVATTDGVSSLELVKTLPKNWAASIRGSSYFRNAGITPRESNYGVGLSHAY